MGGSLNRQADLEAAALADRTERDAEREPRKFRRQRRRQVDLRRQRALKTRVVDGINSAYDTTIVELTCPRCRSAVYAPRDSDREHISCAICGVHLITRQTIGGLGLVLDTRSELP